MLVTIALLPSAADPAKIDLRQLRQSADLRWDRPGQGVPLQGELGKLCQVTQPARERTPRQAILLRLDCKTARAPSTVYSAAFRIFFRALSSILEGIPQNSALLARGPTVSIGSYRVDQVHGLPLGSGIHPRNRAHRKAQ